MQIIGPLSSHWFRLFECGFQVFFYKQPRWFWCTVMLRTLFQSSLCAVCRLSSKTKSDHVTPAEDNPGGSAYRIVSKLPGLVVRALHQLAFACSSLFPHLSPLNPGFQPRITTLMCSILFAFSPLPLLSLINLYWSFEGFFEAICDSLLCTR